MSIAAEIGLTCLREVRRNLRSAKGLLASLLFLLGGSAALLLYTAVRNFIRSRTEERLRQVPPEARREMERQILDAFYGGDKAIVDYVIDAPPQLYVLYQSLLYALPLLVILIGYDQLAGDLQYRTIRFATVRAKRVSLVAGRALGTWAVGAVIAFGLTIVAAVISTAWGDASVPAALAYALRFWLMAVVFSFAYVGVTSLVSSFFRTPTLALMAALATALGLGIVRWILTSSKAPASIAWLGYAFPGTWEPKLLSTEPASVALALLVCLAFGGACGAGAAVVMSRRDV